MTTINFAQALQDAKGATFEPLPVGDYDVEVTKTDAVTSQNGKPMIKTTFKVISGPYERRPIINQFVLSVENPQAVAIFFRHMKAFGLTEEWFASLGQQSSLEPVASALLGRRARLSIGHREWQGEMRNEVKGVKPYTGAPPSAAPVGPTSGPVAGPVPLAGPGATPPRPVAGPTPPAAPVTPPAPVVAPTPSPAVAVVQPMPQPPASAAPAPAPAPEQAVPVAVPTSTSGSEVPAPSFSEPTVATSEPTVAPSAPPALPF